MTWLERLAEDLCREHDAVAAILYGSRARGDARPESDIDLLLLVERPLTSAPPAPPPRTRDARRVTTPDGVEVDLDGWLQSLDGLDPAKDTDLLRLRGGRAAFDPRGLVPPLMDAIARVHAAGPEPVADDERAALAVWGQRMLRRIGNRAPGHELASAFRRAELLTLLLVDIYKLRRWWYPGPEPALRELADRAPELFAAYAAALIDPSDERLAALVALVFADAPSSRAPGDAALPPSC